MDKNNYKIWMVRAGRGGFLVEEFLKEDIIAIGWNDTGKISMDDDYNNLKNNLKKIYVDDPDGRINQSASQLWKFFKEFKIGDRVITYDSGSRLYYTGEIISDYDFNENFTFQHYRKVEWDSYPIQRDLLKTDTKNLLGSILTIFEIPMLTWDEIIKLHPGYISEEEIKELEELEKKYKQEKLEQLKQDIVSRSMEFIKDIISNLSWEDVELLVAGLMNSLGYKSRLTSRGSDLGSDILASPDGLGMLEPRIKVEVKKRTKDKISAPELRNFIGGLRGHDKGLFISTTGFSKEAFYEAERANFPITLIDIDLLVELIIENYESLQPEIKALVPLRKIYWPV